MSTTNLALLALLLPVTVSCSAVIDDIEPRLTHASKGYGEAQSSNILLNIIRAGESEPLLFVASGQFQANRSFQLSNGLPSVSVGPFQTPAQRNYTFGPNSFNNSLGSQVQATPLNTTGFNSAFMLPLTDDDILFFMNAGYPDDLLYYLFFESIRIEDIRTGAQYLLRNEPELDLGSDCSDPAYHTYFDRFVDPVRPENQSRYRIGPTDLNSPECGFSKFKYWIGMTARYGLRLDTVLQKGAQKPEARLCYDLAAMNQYVSENFRSQLGTRLSSSSTPICDTSFASTASSDTLNFPDAKIRLKIKRRSPQAVFRYVGRYALGARGVDVPVQSRSTSRRPENIFNVSREGADCFSMAVHDKETYCVGNDDQNSKAVIAILTQLIQLRTDRADVPINSVSVVIP